MKKKILETEWNEKRKITSGKKCFFCNGTGNIKGKKCILCNGCGMIK